MGLTGSSERVWEKCQCCGYPIFENEAVAWMPQRGWIHEYHLGDE